VSRAEAEFVIRHAQPPFPREMDSEKSIVRGPTGKGRLIQAIYVLHGDENIDYESMTLEDIITVSETTDPVLYVIHARELTAREKMKFRQTR
jgi:hypothetical protein